MTTSPAEPDPPDTIPQSPTRQAAECEEGLRRVLAYICARRHRRLIVFTCVFLVIYPVARIPVSLVSPAITGLLITHALPTNISIEAEMYPLIFSLTEIIPSLLITAAIFNRLRRSYLSYMPPS